MSDAPPKSTPADDPTPTQDPPEETTSDKPPPETTKPSSTPKPTPTSSKQDDKPPETKTSDKPPATTPPPDDNNDDNNDDDNNDDDDTPPAGETSTSIVVITRPNTTQTSISGAKPTNADGSGQTDEGKNNDDDDGDGGLSSGGTIAIAVVVPVVAVALFLIAGIWFWKRRKARKDAEEERRKEVEDYAYNPNTDPTLPPVGGITADAPYEMRDDQASSGYRGWGSTAMGSVGTKAPSGGYTGYSDTTGRRNPSDTRSGEVMMDSRDGAYSPESGEILGAMGPSAAGNRGGDIRRGPSNASSSYSAGGRSDGSDPAGAAYANQYYDPYTGGNPYAGEAYNNNNQRPTELPGQPIIRDNPARRNTRIENPSHYPQQSAGISQNF